MKKISVITVCFNAEKDIRCTIESVLKQDYRNYEYIFIDGKSADSTVSIINSYICEFNIKNIPCKVISEKDSGIFNAMNKGIEYSNGEWLYFLNAGDQLYNRSVFSEIDHFLDTNSDIVFGNTYHYYEDLYRIYDNSNLDELRHKMIFCHQSSFVRKSVLKCGFDEKYKCTADYDFFLKAYLNHLSFKYVNLVISKYNMNGLSSDRIKLWDDFNRIQYDNGLICGKDFFIRRSLNGGKKVLRYILLKMLGDEWLHKRNRKVYFKAGYVKRTNSCD